MTSEQEEQTESPRVLALIATIPGRQRSVERLLVELTKQTRPPDGLVLVLDGYGDAPAPACPDSLPIIVQDRTPALSGPGVRWNAPLGLLPDDILVCLDDDVMLCKAPRLVESLASVLEGGDCAAAAMGFSSAGRRALPGQYARGDLIYGAGCGLTVRARHLVGLHDFADSVVKAGGPDALGPYGDDDALVSAYLWKTGVTIRHAATGNIFAAPATRLTSQTAAVASKRAHPDAQKLAIKRITGWPWFEPIPDIRSYKKVAHGRP